MKKLMNRSAALLLFFMLLLQTAFAAAAPAVLQKIRCSQSPDKVRIVLDLSEIPEYSVSTDTPGKIVIDLPDCTTNGNVTLPNIQDATVATIALQPVSVNRQQLVITVNGQASPKVFSLSGPNRLVIDLDKQDGQKVVQTIAPGLVYTNWQQNRSYGPVVSYIVDADLTKYNVRPVLSNGAIQGLESVKNMAAHNSAIVAVNGSYFASNGEIIGLLKLDNTIVSVPYLTRAAVGITNDNKLVFDEVTYQGTIDLPNHQELPIGGVNCERSENSVTIYNAYYGASTQTNEFGREYVVKNGKITAISPKNTPLTDDGSMVLSAHGTAADAMAGLKVGDSVRVEQSLGPVFDKMPFALGVGPMLVRNGKVYIPTQGEQVAPDIAIGRAPRTAIGITRDNHLLLVVVDGRQSSSGGMTLDELAAFMVRLGAVQAMNCDGGGSSEMVLQGNVLNQPSDGQERLVGDAVAIIAKK